MNNALNLPLAAPSQYNKSNYKIDNVGLWFTLCAEALKKLDRTIGVSIDEIKHHVSKYHGFSLSDSEICTALMKGLTFDIFTMKSGRFFLNKYFYETEELNYEDTPFDKTTNKLAERNSMGNDSDTSLKGTRWNNQTDIAKTKTIDSNDYEAINSINNAPGYLLNSFTRSNLPIPCYKTCSYKEEAFNEHIENSNVNQEVSNQNSDSVQATGISYPAYYNHIEQTKNLEIPKSLKRKWAEIDEPSTSENAIKKNRTEIKNYLKDNIKEFESKYNQKAACKPEEEVVETVIDEKVTPQLVIPHYKKFWTKKNDFKNTGDELPENIGSSILSDLNEDNSSECLAPKQSEVNENKGNELLKNVAVSKLENDTKIIRNVVLLDESIGRYNPYVAPKKNSDSHINFPKSRIKRYMPICNLEIQEREKYKQINKKCKKSLKKKKLKHRNSKSKDKRCCENCLEEEKKEYLKKLKSRKRKLMERLRRLQLKKFRKSNLKFSDKCYRQNIHDTNLPTKGFALWRYFNQDLSYYT